MNKAKVFSERDGKSFLKEKFIDIETTFVNDLKKEQRENTHDPTLGDATEKAWIDLLTMYLPKRYRIARAFAVDHLGHTTDQLDSLIYDAHFTPILFGKDNHQYIPTEAVYATFEIKPEVNAQYLKAAADKVASLRALKRTSAPLESAQGKSDPKPLFQIMGGLFAMKASWKDGFGDTFLRQFNKHVGDGQLNLVLTAESGFCDRLEAGRTQNIITGQGSLIRGLFRLLTALRAKATVAAVQWEKYESVFD